MERRRKGEQLNKSKRSKRFFKHGDKWFFTTRECSIIGPYDSYEDAVEGCDQFVSQIQSISNFHRRPDECA